MEKEFPKVLKGLREEKNLKQKDIAKIISVSERTYSHYENGDREPSIETLIKLAEFYGLPIDVLVGRYKKVNDINKEKNFNENKRLS